MLYVCVLAVVLLVFCIGAAIARCVNKRRRPRWGNEMRESLIGADYMPSRVLRERKADERSKKINPAELRPKEWERQVIGKGSFGMVYKAEFRGQPVAVKEVIVPNSHSKTEPGQSILRAKIRRVSTNFVDEVEMGCSCRHENLVTMLGYSAAPRMLLIIEMMTGGSIFDQLHHSKWQPSPAECLKAAFDVAQGMEYLHTHFELPVIHRDLKSANLLLLQPPASLASRSSGRVQSLSGAATLGSPGAEGLTLLVKISDFGMSRTKSAKEIEQDEVDEETPETDYMTHCGTTLWMAPEILRREKYNEMVDVYAYAMCLLELLSCRLPWHGKGGTAEVPAKVVSGERPDEQLKFRPASPSQGAHAATPARERTTGGPSPSLEAAGEQVLDSLREVVKKAWAQDSTQRDRFPAIVCELERIQTQYQAAFEKHRRTQQVSQVLLEAKSDKELWQQRMKEGSSPKMPGGWE